MFSLDKTADEWTLRSRTSPLQRVLLCCVGLAGVALGFFESKGSTPLILLAIAIGLAVILFAFLTNPDTTTRIDLREKRISVQGLGPGPAAVKSFHFSDIAALQEHQISSETSDSWEARIELRDGRILKLGSEVEGRDEHIRSFLEDIRTATGIGGTPQGPA